MRRRPLVLRAAIAALLLALTVSSGVAARKPIALGIGSPTSTDLASVDVITASLGVRPATWTLWSTWGDRGGRWACIEGLGTCAFPAGLARGLRDKGITPIIYWQPTNPSDPGAGRFERFRRIAQGKHDAYIRRWARAAKQYGGPVIVRFAHEMNGNWFPWSLLNFDNSPAAFQTAWRHIVAIFRAVGATNVAFLFSPFQHCPNCSQARYAEFYPGNGYVDYVGVTAINWGDLQWTSLRGPTGRPARGAPGPDSRTPGRPLGKPVILPEIASHYSGGDKATWLNDGYRIAHQEWPAIQAMVYFDYDMTFAGQPDWRLVQPGDGSAFRAYQALATDPEFRASMPPRPKPGAGRWRLMPTAKQVADDAITHIVAQDGSGEYATIGAALAAAGDGLHDPRATGHLRRVARHRQGRHHRGRQPSRPGRHPAQHRSGLHARRQQRDAGRPDAAWPTGHGHHPRRGTDAAGTPLRGRRAADGPDASPAGHQRHRRVERVTDRQRHHGRHDRHLRRRGHTHPRRQHAQRQRQRTAARCQPGIRRILRANSICDNVTDVELLPGAIAPDRTIDAACP